MGKLTKQERRKVSKPLLWIGLASILMAFAGLTSGYVVSRSALVAENEWLQFALPEQFSYATVAILLSTLTMVGAQVSVRKNRLSAVKAYLGLTLLLAVVFIVFQWQGWQDLTDRGLFFTGEKSNTAVSWVYVITALHWLHVISGVIVLVVTWIKSLRGKYSKQDFLGLSMAAIYWHFLDGLWIYLFLFLLFIR